MPGIARKVIVCAAVDGLIVQPLSSRGQRPAPPVQIAYGDATISPAPRDQLPDVSKSSSYFEAFGVIGLITLSKLSFLVSITRRQQVAQVFGHPIYVVTEVAITPCASQREAEQSVSQTATQLRTSTEDTDAEDSDSDDTASLHASAGDDVDDAVLENINKGTPKHRPTSSVAEDVMSRKGTYGRFANRWFSKITLPSTTQSPRASIDQGASGDSPFKISKDEESDNEARNEARASSLLPKLLRTAQVLYGSSRSFYFSYDVDITSRLGDKPQLPSQEVPFYQQVNSRYFWNHHTSKPFIESGNDALVLPLIQGFVGQRQFVMDSSPPQKDENGQDAVEMTSMADSTLPQPPQETMRSSLDMRPSERRFLVTVVSRRSTKRAGLRYLRRGVDDDGNVANAVETEQILSNSSWDKSNKIHSFLQIRGSIPQFFTQTPYSLKPAPVMQHSQRANYDAAKKHFKQLNADYGALQIVNLVEKHGVEASLGNEYKNTVEKINEDQILGPDTAIGFEWFDFHAACRGMKFENVSMLLDIMRNRLEELGSTVEDDGKVVERQKGVLRTNCMDCLDRTNVCQSSFAKHMLETQLRAEGYDTSAQLDQETTWFNTLWADNGDAVSKQYASTAAMKGDYTRTKKRNYKGQLNDLSLSLTRFYNGMVNDYFSQAAIDFLLGNVSAVVFQEFEAEMMTKDPAVSVVKMRDSAIDQCQKRVVSDETEELIGGWVVLSPPTSNTIKSSLPLDEVVLLLTDAAMYLCRFDWTSDKVSSFERVDLAHITGIRFGTYITSTMASAYTNESKNVGFVVTYEPGKTDFQRTNTSTLSRNLAKVVGQGPAPEQSGDATANNTAVSAVMGGGLSGLIGGNRSKETPSTKQMAFKALYSQSSAAVTESGPTMSEIQQVVSICADVERLAFKAQPGKEKPGTPSIIEKGDIISLEEARQSTSLLDHLSHSIKKLVWAS